MPVGVAALYGQEAPDIAAPLVVSSGRRAMRNCRVDGAVAPLGFLSVTSPTNLELCTPGTD